jgi:hypothetical protein
MDGDGGAASAGAIWSPGGAGTDGPVVAPSGAGETPAFGGLAGWAKAAPASKAAAAAAAIVSLVRMASSRRWRVRSGPFKFHEKLPLNGGLVALCHGFVMSPRDPSVAARREAEHPPQGPDPAANGAQIRQTGSLRRRPDNDVPFLARKNVQFMGDFIRARSKTQRL